MRIIAGEFRGRLLKAPQGRSVRPTSDKLRETLFNILRNDVPGSVFIDCYAGTGAVGLEAVSRGAAQVYMIEQDAAAASVIEANIMALAATSRARLMRTSVKAGLRQLEAQGFRVDICFFDPPYSLLSEALECLEGSGLEHLMSPRGIVIVEHSSRQSTPAQHGLCTRLRVLRSGDSSLSFYGLAEM
jgi:16S rRNA (guanine(966)-N(2))-methyltransferase RsmD